MIRIFDLQLNQYVNKITFPETIVLTENSIDVIEVIRRYRIDITNENFSNLTVCIENENYRGISAWIKKANESEWKKCISLGVIVNNASIEVHVKLSVLNHRYLVKPNRYTFTVNFYNYD